MSLNADLVRSRCTEIEDSIRRLERFQGLTKEQFQANQDTLDIACYRLLIAIESALALCYHVAAKRLRKIPEEYAECFEILCQAGLISGDLADRLQQMARFRNLLVHVYSKVDYGQVYETIRGNLGDLRGFVAAITRLL
jgi:uncharacterized protein YutE (UPF0331/DUF86 family)